MCTNICFPFLQALEATLQHHWKCRVCLRPVLCLTCHSTALTTAADNTVHQRASGTLRWPPGARHFFVPITQPRSFFLPEVVSVSWYSAYIADSVSAALLSSTSSHSDKSNVGHILRRIRCSLSQNWNYLHTWSAKNTVPACTKSTKARVEIKTIDYSKARRLYCICVFTHIILSFLSTCNTSHTSVVGFLVSRSLSHETGHAMRHCLCLHC